MISNNNITYYKLNKEEQEWTRYVFRDIWLFGGKGSSINAGYENANDVNVRIPLNKVKDISIFAIGDIVVKGIYGNIEKQSDLNGLEFYNVTSITINDFGNNPHIHLGGK